MVFSVNGTKPEFHAEAEQHRKHDDGTHDDPDDRVVRHDPCVPDTRCVPLGHGHRRGRRLGRSGGLRGRLGRDRSGRDRRRPRRRRRHRSGRSS